MARGRLLLVVNLHASRAAQSVGSAIAFLAAEGFDLDIRQSPDRRSLADLIRREADAVDAVVVAGGDGTMNAAAPALIGVGKPVGLIPCGTANDLALTLGIPTDPLAAARIVGEGRARRVDVGCVNGVHFLNVASTGLSVRIAERQDETLKKDWGIFSYAVAAIGTLSEAERFDATITCDGHTEAVRACQIAVGNGVHYGGGLTVSSGARIDDGLLDVYAIQTANVADLVALAPSLRSGRLVDRDDVFFVRGRKVRIETAAPMPIDTDGELTTETPADFSVLPGAIEVFAPG